MQMTRRQRAAARRKAAKRGEMAEKTKENVIRNMVKSVPYIAMSDLPTELWFKVFVHGPASEKALFPEWLIQGYCQKAVDLDDADVVLFTGGPDVDPFLYGAEKDITTRFDRELDYEQMKLYDGCFTKGIPMIGICRGAQFLHVMHQGVLYQDVNNHFGDHAIRDVISGEIIKKTSSVHHQMVKAPKDDDDFVLIAVADNVSTVRRLEPGSMEKDGTEDVEAFFYRSTCSLGFQGHPEYRGYTEYSKWVFDTINRFINENPDLAYIRHDDPGTPSRLRIRESLRLERDNRHPPLRAANDEEKETA